MKKIIYLSSIASVVLASGWRLPEQSPNSLALSGAYIANANGAQSAYYNPANMSFNSAKNDFEAALTYIKLSKIKYDDFTSQTLSGDSKSENFLIPTIFYTNKLNQNIDFGLSLTAPGGLSKRWDEPYPKMFAEEFTLKIIEFNPVLSYRLNKNKTIKFGSLVDVKDSRSVNTQKVHGKFSNAKAYLTSISYEVSF